MCFYDYGFGTILLNRQSQHSATRLCKFNRTRLSALTNVTKDSSLYPLFSLHPTEVETAPLPRVCQIHTISGASAHPIAHPGICELSHEGLPFQVVRVSPLPNHRSAQHDRVAATDD